MGLVGSIDAVINTKDDGTPDTFRQLFKKYTRVTVHSPRRENRQLETSWNFYIPYDRSHERGGSVTLPIEMESGIYRYNGPQGYIYLMKVGDL